MKNPEAGPVARISNFYYYSGTLPGFDVNTLVLPSAKIEGTPWILFTQLARKTYKEAAAGYFSPFCCKKQTLLLPHLLNQLTGVGLSYSQTWLLNQFQTQTS